MDFSNSFTTINLTFFLRPTTPITKDLCHFNDGFQLSTRRKDLRRIKTAGFVTEFGAVSESATGLAEVRFVADHFDGDDKDTSMPLSWFYWIRIPPQDDYRKELARTFAPKVAGDILRHAFDASSGAFQLEFRAATTAATEVFIHAALNYPHGYSVETSPQGCVSFEKPSWTKSGSIAFTASSACFGTTIAIRVSAKAP